MVYYRLGNEYKLLANICQIIISLGMIANEKSTFRNLLPLDSERVEVLDVIYEEHPVFQAMMPYYK